MQFLLDTCAISELIKPRPDLGLVAWMESQPDEDLRLSAVTIAELIRGVRKLPNGQRRQSLESWLKADILDVFADRILPFDQFVATTWAEVVVVSEQTGHPLAAFDSMIAATARHHSMTLVTRNVSDMPASVVVLNPWRS